MEYTIQLDEIGGVIFVSAVGDWHPETDDRMVREIMQLVDESGLRKVLLDIRELHFDLSMAKIFERAKVMRDQRLQQGVVSSRVALVYAAGDQKLDTDMKFFETTSQNRRFLIVFLVILKKHGSGSYKASLSQHYPGF